jgi:outer membrane protein assembly factor BamB/fibronectin type 3 domain-containing protein
MEWRFVRNIFVIMVVFLLLIPNLNGNIIGTSMKNNNEKNNKKDISRDIILNSSRSNNGLANAPWPMFGHDLNHTGRSQYDTSKNNGQKKWAFATGWGVDSSPAIDSNGTIYVGSSINKLYALDSNGTEKWNFTTGDMVFSTPAIGSNGTIYFGSNDRKLYALFPNGMMKWDFTTGYAVTSSPAIGSDGTIYFGSEDYRVYALFPNGTKKWDFITGDSVSSSPAIGSDGTIYIGSWDHKLYALFPNGTMKWDFTTGDSVTSSPSIGSDGTIYFGSNDYKLYALFPNGTMKWNFTTGRVVNSSPAIGSDGTIYVGSDNHELYALFPNGTMKWNFTTRGHIDSSPAIGSDGTIYIDSHDGNLYAIYPNGTEKWNFTTDMGGPYNIESSPAIGSNGTIYFSTDFGVLYAIGTSYPPPPQKLKAIAGNAQVELTWTAPRFNGASAITNYTIYRYRFFGGETLVIKIGNVTTYRDNSVRNGGEYDYRVTASNTFGESPSSNEASAYPESTPTAPQEIKTYPYNAQISLYWKPADDNGEDITNYIVYRNGTLLKVLGDVDTYTDLGLVNGVTYSYNISARNKLGEGPKSIGVIAIPRTVPTAPRDLHATPGDFQIILTWMAPASNGGASIKDYEIYRGETSIDEHLYFEGNTNGTSWVDWNVWVGTTYYYWVRAVNAAGRGPRSNEANATPYTIPYAPGLTATAGISNITLSWRVPNHYGGLNPIANYSIYRGTSSHCETLFVKGYTGGTSWVDTNVTVDTLYYYMVSAVNDAGEGKKSNEEVSHTLPIAPELTAIPGNSKVSLSWTVPTWKNMSIKKYNIYRGMAADGETLFDTGHTTHYAPYWVDANVIVGTTFYYKVSAVSDVGEGPRSNEQKATPYAVPDAPTLTATTGISNVTLSWTVPRSNSASITNYNIYRGTIFGDEIIFVKGYTGGTSWVDWNVSEGTKYYYIVCAVNAAGEGSGSNEIIIIAGTSPGVPTGLTVFGGNSQVILRWTAPTTGGTPAQYNIYRADSQIGPYTLIVIASPTVTEYKDTGLTNDHSYWYKINAQNSIGISGNTTAISATTHETSIITIGPYLLGLIIVIIIVLLIVEATRSSRKKKA